MKVLLVGEGGREDAMAWALSRSPEVSLLRAAPGSDGIARRAERVPIASTDLLALVSHASKERYDLVVVGPEAPLVAGLADRLGEQRIPVFGPSARAAEIESSKVFAKEFMARHRIPTAAFRVFSEQGEASRYLDSREVDYPVVVKADGLAAGKGVVIAPDRDAAKQAAAEMLSGRAFGAAGARIVVETLLRGREVSFFVLSDGEAFVDLAACQDYKRAEEGDLGPNTGGMGAYSPSAYLDEETRRRILLTVIAPTLDGLASEGRPYRGALYAGVMLTDAGPRILEFNARFGDPETQVLLPRLDGDWLPLLHGSATGNLRPATPRWKTDAAVCVVLASKGYPGSYVRGVPIRGLGEAEALSGVLVFHAGTERDPGKGFRTRGGRVLGVTALGATLIEARERAYDATERIRWEGKSFRADIALDAADLRPGGTR